jgi:hypothetical protein
MIAEFAVFLSIAVLCFSGLLFTLWILGECVTLLLEQCPTPRRIQRWDVDTKIHRLVDDAGLVRKLVSAAIDPLCDILFLSAF